jgi:hypothetical protein
VPAVPADRDGATVHVELVPVRVDAQLPGRREDLRGKGLVDLDEIDVVDRHPGSREGLLAGLDRPETHDLRGQPADAGGDDPRERGEAEIARIGVGHDDQRVGTVVQRAQSPAVTSQSGRNTGSSWATAS